MKKPALVILTVSAALCLALSGLAFSGRGTADYPYVLAGADDLREFAGRVNAGDEAYAAAYAVLCAPADFAGEAYVPIGTEEHPFRGHFDGGGFLISNVSLSGADASPYTVNTLSDSGRLQTETSVSLGLFGTTDGAVIENVRAGNVTVKMTGITEKLRVYAGLLAGRMTNTVPHTATAVSGCVTQGAIDVTSTVQVTVYEGGLIGFLGSEQCKGCTFSVSDCRVSADLHAASRTFCFMGGCVGQANVKSPDVRLSLRNLVTDGTVTAPSSTTYVWAGGIVAEIEFDDAWSAPVPTAALSAADNLVENVFSAVILPDTLGRMAYGGSICGYKENLNGFGACYTTAYTRTSANYSFAGTAVKTAQLTEQPFLNRLVSDPEKWVLTDTYPTLAEDVKDCRLFSFENGTAVAAYFDEEGEGTAICALYDEAWRVVDVIAAPFTAGKTAVFESGAAGAARAAVFVWDTQTLTPVCGEKRAG